MKKKVLEYQRQLGLIEAKDRIVVGFSGGADSVCLLLVLEELKKELDIELYAVHVEHGIRGEESEKDAVFAEGFCKDRQIPCIVYHVDAPGLAKEKGISLEEAARELRYECFGEALAHFQGTKIAVAHHGDDNAETMLFHLVRGTGIHGLAGIAPKREQLIRPLLCVTRAEIETYVTEKGASYCTDSTNADVTYSRNRIRNCIMPQLLEVNPRAIEHMNHLSRQIEDVYAYVARKARETGEHGLTMVTDGAILQKSVLLAMEPVLLREFLHQVLGRVAGSKKDIGEIHVEQLVTLLTGPTGKMCHFPYGMCGTSSYETVQITKVSQDIMDEGEEAKTDEEVDERCETASAESLTLEEILTAGTVVVDGWKIRAKIQPFDGDCKKIPEKIYTKWLDYDKINNTVLLRNRAIGDYLVINEQGNQKKLKAYLINEKVPRWQRDEVLLLAEESHIIWVIGYRMSEYYKVTSTTKRVLEVQVEKES